MVDIVYNGRYCLQWSILSAMVDISATNQKYSSWTKKVSQTMPLPVPRVLNEAANALPGKLTITTLCLKR